MKCPCNKCDDRFVGCHASCSDYKEWKLEQEKRNEKIRKEVEAESLYYETINPSSRYTSRSSDPRTRNKTPKRNKLGTRADRG